MRLTKHFTLEELTRTTTGIKNVPNDDEVQNLIHTAAMMEQVRKLLGDNPINVNSCFRSEAVNSAVGGTKTSAHRHGLAVDFNCPKFGSITAICRAIAKSNIPFDQLIWEYDSWVHIAFTVGNKNPRRQLLTKRSGKPYVAGIP